MLINFIVSSFSTPSEDAAINFIYDTADYRNSVTCLLRLTKKDEELRVLREELKEVTARWCTVVKNI